MRVLLAALTTTCRALWTVDRGLTKTIHMKKKWFTWSNISNAFFVVFILAMMFIPEVKAWTIQGLMKVGLFQADVPETDHDASSAFRIPSGVIFSDADGRTIDLAAQKGKVIFINFWATWCPPCIAEMPSINGLYHTFKDNKDVLFIMADMDDDFAKAEAFMKKKGLDLPVYSVNALPRDMYTGTLPTTVIIDQSGNMVFHHEGTADYSNPKIKEFIQKLLATGDN